MAQISKVGEKTLPSEKLTKCQVFTRGKNPWVRDILTLKKNLGEKTLPSEKLTKCQVFTRGKNPWVRDILTLKKNLGEKGLEPLHIAALDPKSSASTNFATRPKLVYYLIIK